MCVHRFPRGAALIILSVAIFGCGDAVTNPLHEGFRADPTPILGTWHLVAEDGTADDRYPLVIERGAGVLFGEVQMPIFGEHWQIFFRDVEDWDGEEFHFFHSETFGLTIDRMRWTVRFREREERCPGGPPVGGEAFIPARLMVFGIRGFTYVRPGVRMPDLEQPVVCER